MIESEVTSDYLLLQKRPGLNASKLLAILVPIALFSSLSRWGLGTRIEGSRAKAPTAKR